MQKLTCLITLALSAVMPITAISADKAMPKGKLWYNIDEPIEEPEQPKPKPQPVVMPELTATERMEVFRQATTEALNRAIEEPTVENINTYRVLQNIASERASNFTWQWQRARLSNPELDYEVQHPTGQQASNQYAKSMAQSQEDAIRSFKGYGLIFFYQGDNILDRQQSAIVADFAKRYDLPLLGVSMDGVVLDSIQNNKINDGQAETLGVTIFPALILYNAQLNKVQPVIYGYATQDKIAQSMYAISKDYKNLESATNLRVQNGEQP